MEVSRLILRKFIKDDYLITRIRIKASNFKGVSYFDRTLTDPRGWTVTMPHFHIEQWLKAQLKHILSMRRDYVKTNKDLYRVVLDVYVKMKLKEKHLIQVKKYEGFLR